MAMALRVGQGGIEGCRHRGIDPFEYLRDVLTRMPAMAACDYSQLLPETWAQQRAANTPEGQRQQAGQTALPLPSSTALEGLSVMLTRKALG
jgi:hypothetical protein